EVSAAVIIGASGYAGQETLDRLLTHPELELVALGSDSLAGEPAGALDPRLNGHLPPFVSNEEALAAGADVVFCCLPNERAAALARAPLADGLDPASVAVDGKSGVSGAGRELKPSSHAGFVLENVSPYRVGAHQHAPEIAQALGFPVCFVPHLLPVRRGLIVTSYVKGLERDLRERLEVAYAESHVVTVLPEDMHPELAHVQGTDAAELAVYDDAQSGRTVIV